MSVESRRDSASWAEPPATSPSSWLHLPLSAPLCPSLPTPTLGAIIFQLEPVRLISLYFSAFLHTLAPQLAINYLASILAVPLLSPSLPVVIVLSSLLPVVIYLAPSLPVVVFLPPPSSTLHAPHHSVPSR